VFISLFLKKKKQEEEEVVQQFRSKHSFSFPTLIVYLGNKICNKKLKHVVNQIYQACSFVCFEEEVNATKDKHLQLKPDTCFRPCSFWYF
jgi:uncharacterized protein involved in tolerance to divalent cations